MDIKTEYIENRRRTVYPQTPMTSPLLNQNSSDTSYFRRYKKTVTIDCPTVDYQKFECTDVDW